MNGTTLHYVRGRKGPPVILIQGFPKDWFEYRAIIPRLARRFTIIAVDLRGIGGSKATAGGYDAANLAEDVYPSGGGRLDEVGATSDCRGKRGHDDGVHKASDGHDR